MTMGIDSTAGDDDRNPHGPDVEVGLSAPQLHEVTMKSPWAST